MTRTALLPSTAPFGENDLVSLDRVLSAASPVQRAWLSGFLAGLEAGGAQQQLAAQPAARPAEPLTIVFASESGNAERLAGNAAKLARKLGFKPQIVDMADLEIAWLAKAKRLLVVASTWGEGEPPSRATRAYEELIRGPGVSLDGVDYAVLALGDSAYADFCATGRTIDERLEALGGKRAAARVDCDLDFEKPAGDWIKNALEALAPPRAAADNVLAVDFTARTGGEVSTEPVTAEVVEHINLNSSRSDKETVHLALGFDGAAPAYEPGDSLELFPHNDPAVVDAVLTAADLKADGALLTERDVTTLSVPMLEKFAAATGHGHIRQLVADGQARAWIEGRQL